MVLSDKIRACAIIDGKRVMPCCMRTGLTDAIPHNTVLEDYRRAILLRQ